MKFTVPFIYPCETRAPRARTWNPDYNCSTATVDIAEVDENKTRFVCSVGSRREDSPFQMQPTDKGSSRSPRVVEIEDRLYVERCSVGEFTENPGRLGPRNPFDVVSGGIHGRESLIGPTDKRSEDVAARWKDPRIRSTVAEVRDDGGDARRCAIAERTEELRIVGESVYALVSEPRILVSPSIRQTYRTRQEVDSLVVDVVESRQQSTRFRRPTSGVFRNMTGGEDGATFALDRLEQALAYAEALFRSGEAFASRRKAEHAPTLDNYLVMGPIDAQMLREDACDMIGRVGDHVAKADWVLDWSHETLAAWVEVRDASRVSRRGGSIVAEALRRFCASVESNGDRGGAHLLRAKAAVEECDYALAAGRRWRPVGLIPDTVERVKRGDVMALTGLTAFQDEGWSGAAREVAARLGADFRPGEDMLVHVDGLGFSESGAEALYVVTAAGVVLSSATWGDGEPSGDMAAVAETHAAACAACVDEDPVDELIADAFAM